MSNKTVTSRNDFELLLDWLDTDRETAARKYEKMRQKLIQIFCGRGCYEAEELADITFDRVMTKVPSIVENYSGKPALYFYGVANKVYHEWIRKQSKHEQIEFKDAIEQNTESNDRLECLEQCLEKLSDEKRQIVIGYYKENKGSKIKIRKQLAEKHEISTGALQIKLFRIRQSLHRCITNCLEKKSERF